MRELFREENRAETDRTAEIRAAREAELAGAEEAARDEGPEPVRAPTRRGVISAGLAAAPRPVSDG